MYVILTHMNTQAEELKKHINATYNQIIEAAKQYNLTDVQRHTRKVVELEDLKKQHEIIQQRLANLTSGVTAVTTSTTKEQPQANGKIRELPIEVTDGMIRQNLLTLTPHVKRGRIKIGEELIIEAIPSGERFVTRLMRIGNKLRARGEIAHFYRTTGVKGGDYVVLTEISPGKWTLTKAPHGKYGFAAFNA